LADDLASRAPQIPNLALDLEWERLEIEGRAAACTPYLDEQYRIELSVNVRLDNFFTHV
jgi:hypothetical protein